jgi:hypothetical protein
VLFDARRPEASQGRTEPMLKGEWVEHKGLAKPRDQGQRSLGLKPSTP